MAVTISVDSGVGLVALGDAYESNEQKQLTRQNHG